MSPQARSQICPIVKFAIDATQGQPMVAFGELLLPSRNDVKDPRLWVLVGLDGAKGRLCFAKSGNGTEHQLPCSDEESYCPLSRKATSTYC